MCVCMGKRKRHEKSSQWCACGNMKDEEKRTCDPCKYLMQHNVKFAANPENHPYDKCDCGRYKCVSLRACSVCCNAGRFYVHKNCPTCRCD